MDNKVYLILGEVRYAIRTSELEVNGDKIRLAGTLLRTAPQQSLKSPQNGEIISTLHSSALIRLLNNGNLTTAAITHITPKAWRVYNQEWGAAWIPRSDIEWSDAAAMFCYTGSSPIEFTPDIFQNIWPTNFNPEYLIEECYKD